jgi:hypothetical protein
MAAPLTLEERAALWDAVQDMARIHGQVILIDRLDGGAICSVGGARQTSDATDTVHAVIEAGRKLGIDAVPRSARVEMRLPYPLEEEGGP